MLRLKAFLMVALGFASIASSAAALDRQPTDAQRQAAHQAALARLTVTPPPPILLHRRAAAAAAGAPRTAGAASTARPSANRPAARSANQRPANARERQGNSGQRTPSAANQRRAGPPSGIPNAHRVGAQTALR
jgi:hypothetical protein